MNQPVYLLSGSRTALGAYLGALSTVPAPQLAATAISSALEKAELRPDQISHAWVGQVLQAGVGQAPARQAVLAAGLAEHTSAVTVNKVCGSGLEAIICAVRSIALGETSLAVAGGMENMSLAPHLIPQANWVGSPPVSVSGTGVGVLITL